MQCLDTIWKKNTATYHCQHEISWSVVLIPASFSCKFGLNPAAVKYCEKYKVVIDKIPAYISSRERLELKEGCRLSEEEENESDCFSAMAM